MSNGVEKTEGDDVVISFPYRGEIRMKKYAKGTVIGLIVVSAGLGSYYHANELQKYKTIIKEERSNSDSLARTIKQREESLTVTELELSEAKLGLEAEVIEKGEIKKRLAAVESKYKRSSQEVEELKKTLALLNKELSSISN